MRVYCAKFNRYVDPRKAVRACGEYQGPLTGETCLDCDHCREKWEVQVKVDIRCPPAGMIRLLGNWASVRFRVGERVVKVLRLDLDSEEGLREWWELLEALNRSYTYRYNLIPERGLAHYVVPLSAVERWLKPEES